MVENLQLKRWRSNDDGIQCLMEASIMSTFSHPYLHSAVHIQATSSALYIISEVALADLGRWTKKLERRPNLNQLRLWSYRLCHAVSCLHRNSIIHGDIKASNILLFRDGNIRLGDFTLTVRKWSSDILLRHTVCTYTHRPLEVWLYREWDTSVDIWSLGCTLYEIAYGQSLFPRQENDDKPLNFPDRAINCLLDWGEKMDKTYLKPLSTRQNTEYTTFQLSSEFSNDLHRGFNDFILTMLRLDPTCSSFDS